MSLIAIYLLSFIQLSFALGEYQFAKYCATGFFFFELLTLTFYCMLSLKYKCLN